MLQKIESLQNQTVKHLVNLKNKSTRLEYNQFVAEGLRTITTFIEHGYNLQDLYLTHATFEEYGHLFDTEKITLVTNPVMNKISSASSPSRILAVFEIPEQSFNLTENALLFIDIQDPGNFGTLIRTAAAMGIENVFYINGVDPYCSKSVQASAGAMALVNLIEAPWDQFIDIHKNITLCALISSDGSNPKSLDLKKSILVIGNEAHGLPEEIIKACSQKMTIPMPGKTESLNAAIAGSIGMYLKNEGK